LFPKKVCIIPCIFELKAIIDEEFCMTSAGLVDYERTKKYCIPTRKLTVE